MELLDRWTVLLKNGEKKYIELYHGDLTKIPDEQKVDLLVVSAFAGNYATTEGSLIGALQENLNISLHDLAENKAVDERANFNSWLSQEIPESFHSNFKRIVCFEPNDMQSNPAEYVSQLFRGLLPLLYASENKNGNGNQASPNMPQKSIAISAIGTGKQNIPVKDILKPFLQSALNWLKTGIPVNVIRLVEIDKHKADILEFMFKHFKRQFAVVEERPQDEFDYDLFISYAHKNKDEVMKFVDSIKTNYPNLNIFCDHFEIEKGEAWQHKIFTAIDKSRRAAVVFSPEYLKSDVCITEYNIAYTRARNLKRAFIFPIQLYKIEDMPTYMRMDDYYDCKEGNINKLTSEVSKDIGEKLTEAQHATGGYSIEEKMYSLQNKIKTVELEYVINSLMDKTPGGRPAHCLFMGAGCSYLSNIPLSGKITELLKTESFVKNNCMKPLDLDYNGNAENYIGQLKQLIEESEKKEEFEIYQSLMKDDLENLIDTHEKDWFDKFISPVYFDGKNEELKKSVWAGCKDLVLQDLEYGFWFQEYKSNSKERQYLIEKLIEKGSIKPGYGYLSALINEDFINTIFTTNFDDLLNESLITLLRYSLENKSKKPKVFAHDELASQLDFNTRNAKIIKLHGDFRFANIRNTYSEINETGNRLTEKLKEALNTYGLIVIGYGGADYAIMNALEEAKRLNPENSFHLIWCGLGSYEKLNWRVKSLLGAYPNSYYYEIPEEWGFDVLMVKIALMLNLKQIDLVENAKQVNEEFKKEVEKFVEQYEREFSEKDREKMRKRLGEMYAEKDINKRVETYIADLEKYEKKIQADASNPSPYFGAANIYKELAVLKSEEKNTPDASCLKDLQNKEFYFQAAQKYYEVYEEKETENLSESFFEEVGDYWRTYGWYQEYDEKIQEALACYKKGIEYFNKIPSTHKNYSFALKSIGISYFFIGELQKTPEDYISAVRTLINYILFIKQFDKDAMEKIAKGIVRYRRYGGDEQTFRTVFDNVKISIQQYQSNYELYNLFGNEILEYARGIKEKANSDKNMVIALFNESFGLYEKALEINPELDYVKFNLGLTYMELAGFETGKNVCDLLSKAIKQFCSFTIENRHYKNANINRATCIVRYITLACNADEGKKMLADLQDEIADYDSKATIYNELGKEYYETYYKLNEEAKKENQHLLVQAEQWYNLALDTNTLNSVAFFNLALVRQKKAEQIIYAPAERISNAQQAIYFYLQAYNEEPANLDELIRNSAYLIALMQLDKAPEETIAKSFEILQQPLGKYTNPKEFYYTAGLYLNDWFRANRTDTYLLPQAMQYFKQAIAIDEKYVEAQTELGRCLLDTAGISGYKNADEIETAIDQFKIAEAIDPSYTYIKIDFGNAYYYLATLKKEDAASLYSQALVKYEQAALDKNQPDIYIAYGNWGATLTCLAKLTEDKEKKFKMLVDACTMLRKADELVPGYSNYNLACTFSVLQSEDAALYYLEAYLKTQTQDTSLRADIETEPEFEYLKTFSEFTQLLDKYLPVAQLEPVK